MLVKRVYPRWRGEHANFDAEAYEANRFIPAGAGNTVKLAIGYDDKTVYPRWRGEHDSPGDRYLPGTGLSPLARGTQRASRPEQALVRFIPAGAGNTSYFLLSRSAFSVYPRWRGEHPKSQFDDDAWDGLSPLARGTRTPPRTKPVAERFIPAGAGNTTK